MESAVLSALRALLAFILIVGMVGMGTELFLLEHTEDFWQWTPIVLMGSSLLILIWHFVTRSRVSLRVHQGIMILFVLSGALGSLLHFQGNAEFELEMNPAVQGAELFGKTMMGATPVLAPGTMIQLGLIGLAYAFRHPALRRPAGDQPTSTG
jgi:hypothetical protein